MSALRFDNECHLGHSRAKFLYNTLFTRHQLLSRVVTKKRNALLAKHIWVQCLLEYNSIA